MPVSAVHTCIFKLVNILPMLHFSVHKCIYMHGFVYFLFYLIITENPCIYIDFVYQQIAQIWSEYLIRGNFLFDYGVSPHV